MATADVDQSHAETIMRHSGSISGTVGNLLRIERTHGGLVSHVYRIVGESGEAYAKIRGDRFSALPDIRTEPSEIAYE
ncbi:MAG: hypothetical protein KGH58_04590, partial [Candidatus Micrarchaeota archaeon]|nr:hypothetical protein [Candidatus Micrarchaeota archaeon]